MITKVNQPKASRKHISCECQCRFDERKCNSDEWWENDKCQCEFKKRHVCEKRLYLESFYMKFSKLKIFSKYYGWFNDYV